MPSHPTPTKASTRVVVAAAGGVLVGVAVSLTNVEEYAPLAGWDVAAIVYLCWVWRSVRHLNPEETAKVADAEEPSRVFSDALLLAAAVASLTTVGIVLTAGGTSTSSKFLHAAAAVASVILSWLLVHVVHMLAYARLYYTNNNGGINFNEKNPPAYSDFAYLAFTIGMTFQVSDTDLQSRDMRKLALRHALLSYLFGTVIVATTINLIAGLSG